MKKLCVSIILALCAAAVLAADAGKAKRVRRIRRPSAGILERREAIPTRQIGVFNRQKTVDAGTVATAVAAARLRSSLPLKLDDTNTPVRVELVDGDGTALTILPEEFRAVINVKALATDGAAPEKVTARLRTELARAAFFLLGSGSVSYKCVTKAVRTLAELDAIADAQPSAEAVMHLGAGKLVGVNAISFTSYERACQEGWAPAPTNDIQKAVWDKVHAMPTAPLKIKPETKKVAE